MNYDRIWAMPNKWTSTIKPIRELLAEEIGKGVWLDPFAGFNSPAQETNDLDKTTPTKFHMDALSFIKGYKDNSMDGILLV